MMYILLKAEFQFPLNKIVQEVLGISKTWLKGTF